MNKDTLKVVGLGLVAVAGSVVGYAIGYNTMRIILDKIAYAKVKKANTKMETKESQVKNDYMVKKF